MSYVFNLKINLFICFLLLTFAGKGLGQGNVEKTPPSLEKNLTTSENVVTSKSNPVEVIQKADENLLNARAVRMRMLSMNPRGESQFAFEYEFVAPDRHRTIVWGIEIIKVGNITYRRMSGTEWEKLERKPNPEEITFRNAYKFEEFFKDNIEIKVLGTETLNGMQTMVYQQLYSDTKLGGEKKSSTAKIWIGVSDNLPYRLEIAASNIEGKASIEKDTVDFYYGADIKIDPPI